MHKRGTEHEDSITKLHEQIVSQTNSQSQIPMSPQKNTTVERTTSHIYRPTFKRLQTDLVRN
jgi:hypothetical protein